MYGRAIKKSRLRDETHVKVGLAGESEQVIIGDFGFADDTGWVGLEDEVRTAEAMFEQSLTDWEERVDANKQRGCD